MKYLGVLGLFWGTLLPSESFASLQCTDIFSKNEATESASPIVNLSPELQSILQRNMNALHEYQMTDAVFLTAKSYEDITFAVKNKVNHANNLVQVVVHNIIFLKYNSTPQFFQVQLSKLSADFLNIVSESFRISDSQMNALLHIRIERQLEKIEKAEEALNARQSYMGFREPTSTTGPTEKITIGFGNRNSITEEIAPAPKAIEEVSVEKAPIGFIHFVERVGGDPSQRSEMGFVPRKEAPNNIPRFILTIDGKTGLIDAINPEAKIGF